MNNRPELMAPAGSLDIGIAAFKAGADAVYVGLSRFNARERGNNFSMDDLSVLVSFARKKGKRVYVTLNTLIKENELVDVAGILAELAEIRPDAVIVQDIGVIAIIRKHFPVLKIHASTQMGIHNSAGVNFAKSLGVKRVILERQVTYDELKRIRKNTSVELEVFVHGALCCSRSGECLLSSWMGGWSGNRGKCKQPCRRRYFSDDGNGFFFSTSDLYSLEDIPDLVKLGVSALKIEGRLKRIDYVVNAVKAYRMMLDANATDITRARIKEAKSVLSSALGRKWVRGFSSADVFEQVIDHTKLGAAGLLCGKVKKTNNGRFMVETNRTIRIGDVIRVQPQSGDEGMSFVVTKMTSLTRSVKEVRAGGSGFIYCDKPVEPNSIVYKIGGTVDNKDNTSLLKAPSKQVLDLKIRIDINHLDVLLEGLYSNLEVTESSSDTSSSAKVLSWNCAINAEVAEKHPLSAISVEDQFRKTCSEKYTLGDIDIKVDGALFLPASELKRVRRAFWDWCDATVLPLFIKQRWADALSLAVVDIRRGCESGNVSKETVVRMSGNKKSPLSESATAHYIDNFSSTTDEVVLPSFCGEHSLGELNKKIDQAIRKGIRRFRVTSIYALHLLKNKKNIRLSVSFSIPVCNSMAVREFVGLGANRITAWVELEKKALGLLIEKCGKTIEVYCYGRLPLLSTRFKIPVQGKITDGRGGGFSVIKEAGMSYIFSKNVYSIKPPQGSNVYIDLSHARMNEKGTVDFNYSREML